MPYSYTYYQLLITYMAMPGMPKITVRQVDIARQLGVSQAAVSLVLGGDPTDRVGQEMKLRIEKTAKSMGYQPNLAARQLRGVRSRLLGILIGAGAAPVLFDRVTALERAAMERGYRVLVGQIGDDLDQVSKYVDDFVGRGLDGVICMSHENHDHPGSVPEILSRIKNVVYLRRPAFEHGRFIHIDAADCIHQAIDHLLAHGRRRVGMIVLNDYNQANVHRRQGYIEAMRQHAREYDPNLIWVGDDTLLPSPHEVSNQKADEVVQELVVRQRADAIIAINDDWAAQLIKALRRLGRRVPDDVAIIGQGNFKIASFFDPEITTLDPQNEDFATAAIDLLVEMIEERGELPRRSLTVRPKLIIRESA